MQLFDLRTRRVAVLKQKDMNRTSNYWGIRSAISTETRGSAVIISADYKRRMFPTQENAAGSFAQAERLNAYDDLISRKKNNYPAPKWSDRAPDFANGCKHSDVYEPSFVACSSREFSVGLSLSPKRRGTSFIKWGSAFKLHESHDRVKEPYDCFGGVKSKYKFRQEITVNDALGVVNKRTSGIRGWQRLGVRPREQASEGLATQNGEQFCFERFGRDFEGWAGVVARALRVPACPTLPNLVQRCAAIIGVWYYCGAGARYLGYCSPVTHDHPSIPDDAALLQLGARVTSRLYSASEVGTSSRGMRWTTSLESARVRVHGFIFFAGILRGRAGECVSGGVYRSAGREVCNRAPSITDEEGKELGERLTTSQYGTSMPP
ncbi:hypothetical protein C8F04DRAFT_1315164 [Mycena alexandri]|uniref:Uncharacterized protein n=1 Tax=Mycena alexandri TaxID=1745969 RepID=A0AAD6T5A1_9AGAR|nr:hypothetical protein C8F04DRAFT_1315164 [Mycena alexandri]